MVSANMCLTNSAVFILFVLGIIASRNIALSVLNKLHELGICNIQICHDFIGIVAFPNSDVLHVPLGIFSIILRSNVLARMFVCNRFSLKRRKRCRRKDFIWRAVNVYNDIWLGVFIELLCVIFLVSSARNRHILAYQKTLGSLCHIWRELVAIITNLRHLASPYSIDRKARLNDRSLLSRCAQSFWQRPL